MPSLARGPNSPLNLRNQISRLLNDLPRIHPRSFSFHYIPQQSAFECPATLRAMLVNATTCSLQRSARLNQQLTIISVFDIQAKTFEHETLAATSQFNFGE